MDVTRRPVVIASNRGPLGYREEDGRLVAHRGGGGLISGLTPLMDDGRVTWISAALSDADRRAAEQGIPESTAQPVHLLDIEPEDFDHYYDAIANQTLWFVHHGLFDLTREPELDHGWWTSWDAYRRVNHRFAAAVVEHAPADSVVLVQDYHLTLLAPVVRDARDDLTLVHFHHTPFAGPDGLRILPDGPRAEMLDALAAHHACGFHTPVWAGNYAEVQRRWGGRPEHDRAHVFDATLNSDLDELRRIATSAECEAALADIDRLVGDRRLVVRVDRMELSKNIVRSFHAFDRLLERRSDWHRRVTFVACCYPSRLGVPAYARYRDEVVAAAAEVNRRWGDDTWRPIELLTDDDYPRSIAALRRYDVLVVNPIRDGLNLVAKEGPMLNERDGQLVLSSEAGAWTELEGADDVSPFDVEGTADALAAALDRGDGERSDRARQLRRSASARTPRDWLDDQLAAASRS